MRKVISRVKEALLKMNIWEYGALLLFLFNISVVVYFNLSDLRLSLDPDFAITVYHMREMVNKGTPVLQDFCITTSMEYDNTILFAAPLYAMTHNAFLSVGISNLILVALYIFAIRNIFIAFKVKPGIQFLTMAAIFTPYAFGWLDYFKMLFCAHANYGVKALIPIMLILCMIAYDHRLFKDSFPKWKRIVFMVLYIFLLFVTCVSSGTYTIICGLLPVLMIVVITWWRKLPERKGLSKPTLVSRYTVWAGTIIASITGLLLYKKVYTGGSKIAPLVRFEDFDFNSRAVFIGFFQIFGGLTSEEIPAFSPMGIFFCLKLCLAAIFMIIMFVIIVRFVKERGNYEQYMLFGVTLPVNMLILMIGDMRWGNEEVPYRYYLIGVPVFLVGVGIMLDKLISSEKFGKDSGFFCKTSMFMIPAVLVMAYISFWNFKVTRENMPNKDYVVEMTDFFKTQDVDSVFIVNDYSTALMCKAVDDSRKYASYDSESGSIHLELNYYNEETSFGYYGDRNIIAVPIGTALTDYIPEDKASSYTYVGDARWLNCYLSETNPFK